MKTLLAFSIFLISASFALSQTDNHNWEGEYQYIQKSDNPNHVWHYELSISKTENGYSANFQVWGHQTFKPMRCSVTTEDNTAKFYFEDFTETPGSNNLKKGELVLILEYNNKELITTWSDVIKIWEDFPKDGPGKMEKINNY